MADNRNIEEYVNDTLSLLKLNAELKSDPKRKLNPNSMWSWIHKVSEDITSREEDKPDSIIGDKNFRTSPYWTKKAFDRYSENKKLDVKLRQGLHLEHPVPRGQVVHWLCDLPDPNSENVTCAIELFLLTCWVTGGRGTKFYPGSEEQTLNKGKYIDHDLNIETKLNIGTSMPPNWCFLHGDPWDRYNYVRMKAGSDLSDLTDLTMNLHHPMCLCPVDSPNRIH